MIDPIDRAARAFDLRTTGDDVLTTEDTCLLLPKEHFDLVPRQAVELTGKEVQVRLWAPRTHPADDACSADRAGAWVGVERQRRPRST